MLTPFRHAKPRHAALRALAAGQPAPVPLRPGVIASLLAAGLVVTVGGEAGAWRITVAGRQVLAGVE